MNLRKKYILTSLFLAGGTRSLFAGGVDWALKNGSASTYRIFDAPLVEGMGYFIRTISTFGYVAGYLATALGLVGVLWNAFRLIFGTQQVRKACIDIGLKFLVFTVAVNVYGSLISGVMNFSTRLGMYAGGGYYNTKVTMETLYVNLYDQTKEAKEAMTALMNSIGADGGKVSEKAIRALSANTGYSTDEIRKMFEGENVDVNGGISKYVVESSAVAGGLAGAAAGAMIGSVVPGVGTVIGGIVGGLVGGIGGYFGVGKAASAIEQVAGENELYKKAQDAQEKEMIKKLNDGDYADAFKMFKALNDVVTPVTDESGRISYVYDPVMTVKGTNGSVTYLLSPGAIIKTGVLWANLIKTFEETDYDSDSRTFLGRGLDGTFQSLTHWVLQILLILGIIFSMVFATIQYVMAIFEYFIVTSMGVIFIPCVLFDGTKTYASKLITLFLSFFVKITVTILCLFFVVNMFSKNASIVLTTGKSCSLANFAYLLFTMLLGFILTQNAPQIAMTMLNGTPQLSMGEFLHAAGTIGAGAIAAKKAYQATGKAAAGLASGGLEGAAAFAGTVKGGQVKETDEDGVDRVVRHEKGTFAKAFRNSIASAGNAWGSGIGNTIASFSGIRPIFGQNKGSVGYGKSIKDNPDITNFNESRLDDTGNFRTNRNYWENVTKRQNAAAREAEEADVKPVDVEEDSTADYGEPAKKSDWEKE